METRSAYVYTLTDSAGVVRYVGSAFNPYSRTQTHCAQASFPVIQPFDTKLVAWLKSERRSGRYPNVVIVSVHDSRGVAYAAERLLIERLYGQGVPLLNWIIKGAGRSNWDRHCEMAGSQ
jgi:hypothetical protein